MIRQTGLRQYDFQHNAISVTRLVPLGGGISLNTAGSLTWFANQIDISKMTIRRK